MTINIVVLNLSRKRVINSFSAFSFVLYSNKLLYKELLVLVVWLTDRPNLDKIYISIKKRMKRNEEGYSLTLSKAFKDLIKSENYTHLRLGYDKGLDGLYRIVVQLNSDEVGISLLNEKEAVRLWFDITEYVEQYLENEIPVPLDDDIKLSFKKNGQLESDGIKEIEED